MLHYFLEYFGVEPKFHRDKTSVVSDRKTASSDFHKPLLKLALHH